MSTPTCVRLRLFVALGALAFPALGGTIHVDDDAPNDPGPGDPGFSDPLEDGSAGHPFDAIQEGINAATQPGDQVVIADGTYTGVGNRDLDFHGKAITVRSASGDPSTCVIDCALQGRGFYFHNAEGADSVVEGLTVTNGSVFDYGGGVYCGWYSSPTLSNCTLSGNVVTPGGYECGGGGIYCEWYSSPTLSNCTVSGNSADNGGGVGCRHSSSPALNDCTITANSAAGGFYSGGGGVYCYESNPTVTNCNIVGNIDGGVACWFDEYTNRPTLTSCMIIGNDGGGVLCYVSNPNLTNCLIGGNSIAWGGSGVHCHEGGHPTVVNCTIGGNSSGSGGGIWCHSEGSHPTLINCVLAGNAPQEIYAEGSGTPVVSYCNVMGGWPGAGNINADPLFVDPDGPDNDPSTWEDNDYRLAAGSPCIDAADNNAVPPDTFDLDGDGNTAEPIPFDLAGAPRFFNDPDTPDTGNGSPPIVDMGAHEYVLWCRGDADCSGGAPDFGDIEYFVAALTGEGPWAAYHACHGHMFDTPPCPYLVNDLNGGGVEFTDIAAFIAHLGQPCDPL